MSETRRGKYFEEFKAGDASMSPARTVTEADIVMFAGLTGDYNALHTDEEYGRTTIFGRRVAHGLLGLTYAIGLGTRLGELDETVMAFLGLEWKFKGPIFAGDTIRMKSTVASTKETKKPDRGIIEFVTEVLNQKGEVVQEGRKIVMVRRRPG